MKKIIFCSLAFFSQQYNAMTFPNNLKSEHASLFGLCKEIATYTWREFFFDNQDDETTEIPDRPLATEICIIPVLSTPQHTYTEHILQQPVTVDDMQNLFKQAKDRAIHKRQQIKQVELQKFTEKIQIIIQKRKTFLTNSKTALMNYKKQQKQLADLQKIAHIAHYVTATLYFKKWQHFTKEIHQHKEKKQALLKAIQSTENMGFVLIEKD